MGMDDEALETFKELWDESTKQQRMDFLRRFAAHLDILSMETYSRMKTDKLRVGVLIGLVGLFNGEADVGSF